MDKYPLDNKNNDPQELRKSPINSNQTSHEGDEDPHSYYKMVTLTEEELKDLNTFRALKGLPPVTE